MSAAVNLAKMVARLTVALAAWAKGGFPVTDKETLRKRATICHGCPEWDANAFAGLGRCNKCGCSAIKLGMDTSKCPLGKW